MKNAIIAVLFIIATLPAFARLGETEDQCVARYGPVVLRDTDSSPLKLPLLAFAKNGFTFGALMLNAKVGLLTIQKTDKSSFSDNELDLFLAANSAGQKWIRSDDISVNQDWVRDDGAKAEYNPFAHTFGFASKEYLAAMAEATKADETKKTSGF